MRPIGSVHRSRTGANQCPCPKGYIHTHARTYIYIYTWRILIFIGSWPSDFSPMSIPMPPATTHRDRGRTRSRRGRSRPSTMGTVNRRIERRRRRRREKREERGVGEGFCNGKLPHEKVVKRGRSGGKERTGWRRRWFEYRRWGTVKDHEAWATVRYMAAPYDLSSFSSYLRKIGAARATARFNAVTRAFVTVNPAPLENDTEPENVHRCCRRTRKSRIIREVICDGEPRVDNINTVRRNGLSTGP